MHDARGLRTLRRISISPVTSPLCTADPHTPPSRWPRQTGPFPVHGCYPAATEPGRRGMLAIGGSVARNCGARVFRWHGSAHQAWHLLSVLLWAPTIRRRWPRRAPCDAGQSRRGGRTVPLVSGHPHFLHPAAAAHIVAPTRSTHRHPCLPFPKLQPSPPTHAAT